MDRLRKFGAWVYNWITVLTGVVIGALSVGSDAINSILASVDISPLISPYFTPEHAMQITICVAIAKGLHAWRCSRKAAA